MTTEPKPYTLAEWRARLSPNIFEMIQEELRESGLIAEEPVDSLLVEARQIIADTCDTHESKGQWLDGVWDDEQEMDIALAALRRGMELGRSDCSEALAPRKELTREMVRSALLVAQYYPSELGVNRLHAALTEALQ